MQTSDDTLCPHCGESSRPSMPHFPFCCSGCWIANQFLKEKGLTDFYRLRDTKGLPIGDLDLLSDGLLNWVPGLLERLQSNSPKEILELSCEIQGIHCSACVWVIEKLFKRSQGAKQIIINPFLGRITMRFSPEKLNARQFLSDLWRMGYRTSPLDSHKTSQPQTDSLFIRFGISVALTLNSMMLSVSTYFGLGSLNDVFLYDLFMWANWVLSCFNVAVGGFVFIQSAYFAIRRGILHLDLPIALGIILTFTGSSLAFFSGRANAIYLDTVNVFITLMLLGRILMKRVVEQNKKRLLGESGWDRIFIRKLNKDNRLAFVPMMELKTGDTILVSKGDIIPAKAQLKKEGGDFSLEWINGESENVHYSPQQIVEPGAYYVGSRSLLLEVKEAPEHSALVRLLTNPNSEEQTLIPLLPHTSHYYVTAVLLLALTGFLAWYSYSPWKAMDVSIAILVVTCPCAIGLAIPLAIDCALSNLRNKGFYVRQMDFLQRILQVRKIILDKTGTLTLSEPTVKEVLGETLSYETAAILYQMTLSSHHPKSRALSGYLEKIYGKIPLQEKLTVTEQEGLGLETSWDNKNYRLGSPVFALGKENPSADVYFSIDKKYTSQFLFDEQLKYDVVEECRSLHGQGFELFLLSGDTLSRVQKIQARLHIPPSNCFASQSPEGKATVVKNLDKQDTLMLGDGLNDSLAFEKAFCRGTPAAHRPALPQKADFFYFGSGIGPIQQIFEIAATLKQVLKRNVIYALSYNLIAISLCLAGHMSPLLAAILMPTSSILILLATLFSMRLTPQRAKANI